MTTSIKMCIFKYVALAILIAQVIFPPWNNYKYAKGTVCGYDGQGVRYQFIFSRRDTLDEFNGELLMIQEATSLFILSIAALAKNQIQETRKMKIYWSKRLQE